MLSTQSNQHFFRKYMIVKRHCLHNAVFQRIRIYHSYSVSLELYFYILSIEVHLTIKYFVTFSKVHDLELLDLDI